MSAPEIYRYTPGAPPASVAALRERYATVDPANARSLRLLARLGFVEVAPALYPHGDTEPGDRVFSRAWPTSRTTGASSPPSSSSS